MPIDLPRSGPTTGLIAGLNLQPVPGERLVIGTVGHYLPGGGYQVMDAANRNDFVTRPGSGSYGPWGSHSTNAGFRLGNIWLARSVASGGTLSTAIPFMLVDFNQPRPETTPVVALDAGVWVRIAPVDNGIERKFQLKLIGWGTDEVAQVVETAGDFEFRIDRGVLGTTGVWPRKRTIR